VVDLGFIMILIERIDSGWRLGTRNVLTAGGYVCGFPGGSGFMDDG
jgi:hypothetical protein